MRRFQKVNCLGHRQTAHVSTKSGFQKCKIYHGIHLYIMEQKPSKLDQTGAACLYSHGGLWLCRSRADIFKKLVRCNRQLSRPASPIIGTMSSFELCLECTIIRIRSRKGQSYPAGCSASFNRDSNHQHPSRFSFPECWCNTESLPEDRSL